MNMEMRGEAASMLNRKCVVLKWAELTVTHFLNLVHRGAGALVLLLPPEHLVEEEEVEVGVNSRLKYIVKTLHTHDYTCIFWYIGAV